jgi:hypothetical protein
MVDATLIKAGQAACNNGSTVASAVTQCGAPDEIEALILYSTLGAPQILPPRAAQCTILIATNANGHNKLLDPCRGTVLVNHHLQLMALTDKKDTSLPVPDWHLYGGIKDAYYDEERNKANGESCAGISSRSSRWRSRLASCMSP